MLTDSHHNSLYNNNQNKDNDIAQEGPLMPLSPPLNVRGIQRSRQRRRIQSHGGRWFLTTADVFSVIILALFLLLIIIVSATTAGASQERSGKWLQHRLRQLAEPHMETFTPIDRSSFSSSSSSSSSNFDDDDADRQDASSSSTTTTTTTSPLLVVATHEGQVWTMDSRDGTVLAGFSTGAPLLVLDGHFEEPKDNDEESLPPTIPAGFLSQSHIVPSLDGILYWRQPAEDSSDNNNNKAAPPKLVPIASIRDLVDNPIQMCHEMDGENCDILTATNLGPSLFSLNDQGSLNWARARGSSTAVSTNTNPQTSSGNLEERDIDLDSNSDEDTEEFSSSSSSRTPKTSLLLQRQDYLVQQISTQTGEQLWNITWGSLEALDFAGQNQETDGSSSRGRGAQSSRYLSSGEEVASSLPSIIFANEGKSLVAVGTQPPKFLWKRDFPSVVTNVLGIEHNSWQALNVVDEDEDVQDARRQGQWSGNNRHKHPRLTAEEQPQYHQEEADYWYWWWAGKGGDKKGRDSEFHTKYNLQQQKENGFVFVPRPDADKVVRNGWYLNQLWKSLQSRGGKSFQRFLSDRPHDDNTNSGKRDDMQLQSRQETYQYPPRQHDNFYDTSSMPRLVLLPPSDHLNLELPSPAGGVFLSWTIVMAIITILVGTAGAAYIIYGHKKRKWLAQSSEESNSGIAPDSTATTSLSMPGATVRGRSISTGSYADNPNSPNKEALQKSTGSNGSGGRDLAKELSWRFSGKLKRATLNRCASAPLMSVDDDNIFSDQQSIMPGTSNGRELSPNNRRVSSPIGEQRNAETQEVVRSPLIKHQSAPVEAPEEVPPRGGVGMIDGIPLIRYSRYQSEFREVEPLGKGGFGSVFRCSNVLDGRQYAVKKVAIRSHDSNAPGTEAFSQELHRVLREVKFLALLDHPNIVRYYTAWLEMEEKEAAAAAADENTNSKKMARRFSSGLLTSMDPSNTNVESHSTFGNTASKSTVSKSHLKQLKNAANPLGWNNDFDTFVEESVSFRPKTTKPVLPSMEDCGFIFEEASEDIQAENDPSLFNGNLYSNRGRSVASSDGSKSEFSHSLSSSWDASYSTKNRKKDPTVGDATSEVKATSEYMAKHKKALTHTLYIQMQLCSSKTLADFLANAEARQGPAAKHRTFSGEGNVDIPYALRLFNQIVQAVHHVHQQGLIHRDLKPSNCFIDESGVVKVGDFGLSRESNDNNDDSESPSMILDEQQEIEVAGDNTVGVGTRSYSSPEQINGSDYDSKTDIYSLGVMLFELLYPMYTGMERTICFQKLRSNCVFPEGWKPTVTIPFPTLDELVKSMLSHQPKDRPTADNVARNIQGLLEEYSITLNNNRHDGDNDNVIYLRIEAKPAPDVLKHTIQLIQEAAAPQTIEVVQYGMRSSNKNSATHQKRSVLEFALASPDVELSGMAAWGSSLVLKLEAHDEILVARHVWMRS